MTDIRVTRIKRVIFENKPNGYAVLACSPELVAVLKGIERPAVGDYVVLFGEFRKHPKYGKQLHVAHWRKHEPVRPGERAELAIVDEARKAQGSPVNAPQFDPDSIPADLLTEGDGDHAAWIKARALHGEDLNRRRDVN